MRQLTNLDAYFLAAETGRVPQHVSALVILDPADLPGQTITLDQMTQLVADRLHTLPPFSQRLIEVPLNLDHGYWFDDPDFDLDFHIREIALPAPGSAEQLKEQVARIFARPLDRARPLWELYLIHGLEGGRIGLLTKIHHALVDGVSGAEILGRLLDLSPDPPPIDPPAVRPSGKKPPTELDMLGRGIAGMPRRMGRALATIPTVLANAAAMPVVGDLPGAQAFGGLVARLQGKRLPSVERPKTGTVPRTSFNGAISGHRRLGFTALPLEDVKRVKSAFGVTVNDVVMALAAAAIRRWLVEHDELPAEPLVAVVPVSVRTDAQAGTHGNKVSGMLVPIPTDKTDATERIELASSAMRAAKEYHKAVPADILSDATQFIPPALLGQAARAVTALTTLPALRPAMNVNISNVPGPQIPLYCGGATVEALYPLAGIVDGMGLNIVVMSYHGQVYVSVIADREQIPDVQRIADWMSDDLRDLVKQSTKGGK